MLLQMTLFHSFMAEQCSIVYTNHIFFIHFCTDGHLGCFYVLAIARKQCCNEPWGACIFSNYDFLQIYIQDKPWDFFGRNDAKAETPVLWPPHAKSGLIGKDSDAGKD